MKQQTFACFLCVLISTSVCGITYAQWNDVIEIHSTMRFGTLTLRFVDPLDCSDNEVTEDVGQFNCYYTDADPKEGYEKLVIGISNAYPSYAVHCNFILKNIETLPSKIVAVNILDPTGELQWKWTIEHTEGILWKDLNGNTAYDPDEEIIYITITELVDVILGASETMAAQMNVHIPENAEECHTYGFEVEIIYE